MGILQIHLPVYSGSLSINENKDYYVLNIQMQYLAALDEE